jgi:hypothetical protein
MRHGRALQLARGLCGSSAGPDGDAGQACMRRRTPVPCWPHALSGSADRHGRGLARRAARGRGAPSKKEGGERRRPPALKHAPR